MGRLVKHFECVSVCHMFSAALLLGFFIAMQEWGPGLPVPSSILPLFKRVSRTNIAPPPVDWAKIPKLPKVARGPDHWIVTTSINGPTEAIRILANLSNWQVIVVGDTKSPKNYSLNGVIFLDVEAQARLGYRILNHVPFRSYARKNIGYLYAIQHGAKVIYETDDDNLLIVPEISTSFDVKMDSSKENLQYTTQEGREVVNPYVHFGQPSMWPRGYPLDAIEKNSVESSYDAVPSGCQLIQQGLANGDPDVDGIFRLTRRTEGQLIRVSFDSSAPSVSLPAGTMCPFNSQNTLFHRGAFWGLMIPVSTSFRVCDIWRGYWAQRLLWDIGGLLSFYPPSVRQDRNIHNFFHDFLDEKALYEDAGRLVHFLLGWKSDRRHFFDRVLQLSHAMVQEKFWGSTDADMTLAWLQDLVSLGYEAPKIREPPPPLAKSIKFVPAVLPSSHLLPAGALALQASDVSIRQLAHLRHFFKDVVLILNYDSPDHSSLLFWRMIYSRIFEHIIVLSTQGDNELGITGVPDADNGLLSYRALPDVFGRFPEAEGFLFINNDVVLNYWNLLGADKAKIWNVQNCPQCNPKQPAWFNYPNPQVETDWWANSNYTTAEFINAVEELPPRYRERLRKAVPEGKVPMAWSDFFYIPRRFVGAMTGVTQIFAGRHVLREMAIPGMLLSVAKADDFDNKAFSNSRYLSGDDLDNDPSLFYTTDLDALHPWRGNDQVQLSAILQALSKGDPQLTGFFLSPEESDQSTSAADTLPTPESGDQ